ncbi:MAG TPA: helix-turn-helix transcriptional regulator [Burkholderiales bacterium]|jgi:DNA-binding transcriptional ArsR family regulator|nr:helix-turn-helix transcriptional regulator [Burkholderiales bacterium]
MDGSDLARIAGLFADPSRARILRTLIDGTLRPAGELAFAANISAQSASAHLAKLVDGGLLELQAQGRHRYFRIANPEVADAVESLGSLGETLRPRAPRPPALPRAAPPQFLRARTCYDHLAGETAVQVCAAMLKARWLLPQGRDFGLTPLGEERLGALGLDVEAAHASRRAFARACVDLTQRRPHIGGALGEALLEMYLARGWILRMRRSRAVSITPKGTEAFGRLCA